MTRKLRKNSDLQVRIETHDPPSSGSTRHVNSTYRTALRKNNVFISSPVTWQTPQHCSLHC